MLKPEIANTAKPCNMFMSVLGRIVKMDQIPNTEYIRILKIEQILNTEYIRFLKNERIRIRNSGIQTQLFQ